MSCHVSSHQETKTLTIHRVVFAWGHDVSLNVIGLSMSPLNEDIESPIKNNLSCCPRCHEAITLMSHGQVLKANERAYLWTHQLRHVRFLKNLLTLHSPR